MNRPWTWSSCLVGLALLCLPQQGQALSFTVDSATVNVGDVFTINLNVADAVDLTSWQVDLAYDASLLQASVAGATSGAFLPGDWFFTSPGFVDNTAGQILGVSAFGSAVSGSGVLASIQFTALGTGISALTASNVFLNFADSGFSVTNGSVCINGATACDGGGGGTGVPEPSSLLLLLLGGLLFWGGQRWSGQAGVAR